MEMKMSTEMTVVPPCSSERAVLEGDARCCDCVVCGAPTTRLWRQWVEERNGSWHQLELEAASAEHPRLLKRGDAVLSVAHVVRH